MKTIKDLEPKALWENFYLLTQVPRPSNHEEKARKFMLEWAKEHHIDAHMDEAGNIIMRKPATPGMENRKGVILQGHLDMVPQKNADTVHDFLTDPIQTWIDGEWVRAKGTTLGADNGMGVAAGMALLLSTDIPHGPLEVLVTATEETGMDGAKALKLGELNGDILMNLDSETEGELYVGCAGGVDFTGEFHYKEEAVPAGMQAFRLAVKGLKGGHSGMEINVGRGNSNKLLFRLLKCKAEELGIRMADIQGGSMRNAIPRESFTTIVVPAENVAKFKEAVAKAEAVFQAELSATEPDLAVVLEAAEMPATVIDACTQSRLINAICACPNGAQRMVDTMPDTVETSSNLAIVASENGVISVKCLLRSSVETAKMALAQSIQATFELAKADKIDFTGNYPGWKPNMDSPILKEMQDIYEKMYGKRPAVVAVHAGLECGLLGAKYTNWDMISFGPTIKSPHSPNERVNIASVVKYFDFLKETLKNIPAK